MLTRSIAAEYADHGVRASCVCPAGYSTSIGQHTQEDAVHWTSAVTEGMRVYDLSAIQPIRGPANSSEIASVVAFLASDDASIVTGAVVMADAGWHTAVYYSQAALGASVAR